MSRCNICPRNCNVDRLTGEKGVCNVSGTGVYVARAALHMWEESCISGREGSGTIFFSGCNLRCVYCQNNEISRGITGKEITVEKLADIFMTLQEKGADNINLVTPSHYGEQIIKAVSVARNSGLSLPVVYNTSGYEKTETLKKLKGIVDVYLTDFKYMEPETALRYSRAEDYPGVAKAAVEEMVRQTGVPVFDNKGMMIKGVIVRHLLLPGHVREAQRIVEYLYNAYKNNIYISLMNQYTPIGNLEGYPEIRRRVTKREYKRLVNYAIGLGVENGFIQEGDTAKESFIPPFDCEGIL